MSMFFHLFSHSVIHSENSILEVHIFCHFYLSSIIGAAIHWLANSTVFLALHKILFNQHSCHLRTHPPTTNTLPNKTTHSRVDRKSFHTSCRCWLSGGRRWSVMFKCSALRFWTAQCGISGSHIDPLPRHSRIRTTPLTSRQWSTSWMGGSGWGWHR